MEFSNISGIGNPEPLKERMAINRNTPDGLISGAFLLSLTDFSNFMLLSNVVALLLSQYLILEFPFCRKSVLLMARGFRYTERL